MHSSLPILFEALRDVLPMLRNTSDERLEKKIGKEKSIEVAEDIAGFISFGVKRELDKNQQSGLTSQLIRCLANYMKTDLYPPRHLTLNNIIENISLLHEAVDKAFPGYADAGILLAIIQPSQAFLPTRK